MNSGVFQSCRVKQMMKGNPSCWDMNNPRPTPLQTSHPLISPPSLTSSSPFSQYPHPSNLLPMTTWNDTQELPESWSQLLLGGFGEEEDRCCFSPFQPKRMENWNDEVDVKQEISEGGYDYGHRKEEWTRTLQTASPSSCATGLNNNSNMFDFSNSKAERSNHKLDHSSEARQIECNSTATGSAVKKARTEASSTQSTFKVRKEKLGDRITALHQLVSPYGKTDTASVLLEAIGYIRFLQSQIEVLSLPYLSCGSGSVRQSVQGERSCIFPEDPGQLLNDINMNRRGPSDQVGDDEPKDLKRRGLCLVPMSFMLHVGSNNGADYWAPSYGGVF